MVGLAFDVEGTPRRPLDLVRDGVTRAICSTPDGRPRRRPRRESTGHAVEGGATWGALGGKFVVPTPASATTTR